MGVPRFLLVKTPPVTVTLAIQFVSFLPHSDQPLTFILRIAVSEEDARMAEESSARRAKLRATLLDDEVATVNAL